MSLATHASGTMVQSQVDLMILLIGKKISNFNDDEHG